jgi:DNA (cytosine-5)-methyltransferase 1
MFTLTPHSIYNCSGIGGFRLAFEKAGYQCVYSCEIDEACQKVYFNNFGEIPKSDITQVNIKEIPDFDILTAGFPCQPFSICGKRGGFQDTRGTLFFYICEILETKRPSVVILENVKHLIHHDKGRTLDIILYALEDLGYLVDYKVLNAKNFGVPQNRERIIIVATKNIKFNFSKLNSVHPVPQLQSFLCQNHAFEYLRSEEYTMIDTPKKQASGLIFVGYRNKNIWKKGVRPNTHHLSRVHHQPNRIYSIAGVHPTIPSQETSGRFFIYIPEENVVRKLTIKECYRLMGFPNDFIVHSNLGECYKQVGNSVCIPMIYELAMEIKKQIFISSTQHQDVQSSKSKFSLVKNIQLKLPVFNYMNHREKLIQSYESSENIEDIQELINIEEQEFLTEIAQKCFQQTGVYTVLITLLVHKTLYPDQDIRCHQSNMKGGFSGRTIDTQHITPTLKELGLPAMAESGWLIRSLEQPYPYTVDYNGKISDKAVKKAFLQVIGYVQSKPDQAEIILRFLLHQVRKGTEKSKVIITRLSNADKLDINTILSCLNEHFEFGYKTSGASKLPVLAFYTIYQLLVLEVERYKSCSLKQLGSHTASDLTSKSAGDIEIFDKNKNLIEAIEIKHGKKIDMQILRIAKDKIVRFNPRRYCIFSSADIEVSQAEVIALEIKNIAKEHGCQIIIN